MEDIKERSTSEIASLSHDELATDLATHLRGASKRVTWEDMQLGPSGSPRPDDYTMESTYTRLTFEAFECKVSVADFRSDVTTGKWQSYLKYANSVTFAVRAGLIDKSAVPATCGLIARSASGVWRYQKKPTRTVLTEIPWKAWIKLLLDGTQRAGYTAKRDSSSVSRDEFSRTKRFIEKLGLHVVRDAAEIPMAAPGVSYRKVFRYFCCVCWNKVREKN